MSDLSHREDIAYTIFRLIDQEVGYRGGYPGDLDYRIADAILEAGYIKQVSTAPPATSEEVDAEALYIANRYRPSGMKVRFLSTLAPHAQELYREIAKKNLECQ